MNFAELTAWSPTNFTDVATEHTYKVIAAVEKIAKAIGKTPSQVAQRWLMQKSFVPSVTLGSRTMAHLKDGLGCLTFSLSAEQVAELDEVSKITNPYPYNIQERGNANRLR